MLKTTSISFVLIVVLASCSSSSTDTPTDPVADDGTTIADNGTVLEPVAPGDGVVNDVDPDNLTGEDCSIAAINQWADGAMRDRYLHYDQVPQLTLAEYDSPEQLVMDLRVNPPDDFSYLADDTPTQQSLPEGTRFDFGYKLRRDAEDNVRFYIVYPLGPAADAGIVRGDTMTAVNGVPLRELTDEQTAEFFGDAMDPRTIEITVRNISGEMRNVSVSRADYSFSGELITQYSRFENGVNIGYIALRGLSEPLGDQLDGMINFLSENSIDEMILDLRYSSSGSFEIANKLASQLTGTEYTGQISTLFRFNDKYTVEEQTYRFTEQQFALNLSRVVILTSADTFGSNEDLFLSLEPYIDVTTIGQPTGGGTFFFRSFRKCGKVLRATTGFTVNSVEESAINGLPADCISTDNIRYPLGDNRESGFAAAVNFLIDGTCSTVPASEIQSGLRKHNTIESALYWQSEN